MADEDWLRRFHARQGRQRQHSERLAEYLAPALGFLGVVAVIVEFDGYGDSGDVQAPVFEWREDAEMEGEVRDHLPQGLLPFIEEACRWALPSGWDDNAGSRGEWIIDVESGAPELELSWRHEEFDADEE
jgi:hypothetical protein